MPKLTSSSLASSAASSGAAVTSGGGAPSCAARRASPAAKLAATKRAQTVRPRCGMTPPRIAGAARAAGWLRSLARPTRSVQLQVERDLGVRPLRVRNPPDLLVADVENRRRHGLDLVTLRLGLGVEGA